MVKLTELRHEKSQLDKFKEAAEEAQCDPDEARWEERLKKVAKHKPEPDKSS
jgi:hypothetical protein